MERGDGFGVSVHRGIITVHSDVITAALGTPEAHQASARQTSVVEHLLEQLLGVIKDSTSF